MPTNNTCADVQSKTSVRPRGLRVEADGQMELFFVHAACVSVAINALVTSRQRTGYPMLCFPDLQEERCIFQSLFPVCSLDERGMSSLWRLADKGRVVTRRLEYAFEWGVGIWKTQSKGTKSTTTLRTTHSQCAIYVCYKNCRAKQKPVTHYEQVG